MRTLLVVLLLAGTAAAEPAPPPLPQGKTPPGRAASKLLGNVDWLMHRPVCIAGESSIPGKLEQARGIIVQIPAGDERTAFDTWLAAANAFWTAEATGPATLPWSELATRQHAFAERLRLLGQKPVATDADLDALYKEVGEITATAATDHPIVAALTSPCGKATAAGYAKATEPAELQKELTRTLTGQLQKVHDPVAGFEQRMAKLVAHPPPAALLDVGEMIDELRAILNELPAAKTAAGRAERWGTLLDPWWTEAPKRIAALEAGIGPMLDHLLGPVAMPAEVTPARAADAKRLVQDKVLAIRVTSAKRDEDHDVETGTVVKLAGGQLYIVKVGYHAVFESYDVRWVTTKLPERWAAIPGVAPGALCAIRGGYLRRYKQGRGIPLGVWTLEEEHDFAPMLCKNAKETSTLR